MKNYTVKIDEEIPAFNSLPFCAVAPDGTTLTVNNKYFIKNGKPWYPVMGEFHYSRYPADEWEENLRKMKAGGVQIVASYFIWIHHEEEKGIWDFSGSRNLRKFLELCQKVGLQVWLRVGPWAHGEVRNGGFPDWLEHDNSFKKRTDDPTYLSLVDTLFHKIYEQAQGCFFADGGCIVGIQLENEYGHCGGENGSAGLQHMSTLKQMAIKSGLCAPFYTATGWGGANVVDGEMLPVQGGYADAPWEHHTSELPASENFLLAPFKNDPLIGSDWGKHDVDFTFRVDDYPFLTAELGGGIQVTAIRRPVVTAVDTAAMAMCKLGIGANLLGYYMYHGGTNPQGKLSTLQESTATGSSTDVPELSYDFQAVIGEYGELHESYRKLKTIHTFLADFGELIAPARCVYPENMVTKAENTDTLRYNVRHNDSYGGGFLFINNHQRHRKMLNHGAVEFSVQTPSGTVNFPEITVLDDTYGFYPYNLPMGESLLISTNAQLLCKLGETYVFFCDGEAKFNFAGEESSVIVLTTEQAENAWKIGDKLYITCGELIEESDGITLISSAPEVTVTAYPEKIAQTFSFEQKAPKCTVNPLSLNENVAEYALALNDIPTSDKIYDVFLELTYEGDRAELYIGDNLVADWFTTGMKWRVSLKRLGYPKSLTLKIYAKTGAVYYEFEPTQNLTLNSALMDCKYTINI